MHSRQYKIEIVCENSATIPKINGNKSPRLPCLHSDWTGQLINFNVVLINRRVTTSKSYQQLALVGLIPPRWHYSLVESQKLINAMGVVQNPDLLSRASWWFKKRTDKHCIEILFRSKLEVLDYWAYVIWTQEIICRTRCTIDVANFSIGVEISSEFANGHNAWWLATPFHSQNRGLFCRSFWG